MPVTPYLRNLVRRNAIRFPALYQLRSESLLVQRLRGSIHDDDFRNLGLLSDRVKVIYDVGANIGQAALTLQRLFPDAEIVSFEPQPHAIRRLAAKATSSRHTIVPMACAEATGLMRTIYVPHVGRLPFRQLASLCPLDAEEIATYLTANGFGAIRSETVWFEEQPIVTVSLDDFAGTPDLLKIDVEGAEPDVLRGASRILSTVRPTLIVETDKSDEASVYLQDFSYRAERRRYNTIFRPE